MNKLASQNKIFSKSLIMRGVGYSFLIVRNLLFLHKKYLWDQNYTNPQKTDFNTLGHISSYEFYYDRYIIIYAGHTQEVYKAIPNNVFIKISRKNKKIVVFGFDNKGAVNNFAAHLIKSRIPSPYTGRGIRSKHVKIKRKVGKRDDRKGRRF